MLAANSPQCTLRPIKSGIANMDADKQFFEVIDQLKKKQRQMVIAVGVLAFIVGVIVGSVWTYNNIDRVTIISTAPQIKV